jgi:uncharacterized protein YbgA (DUF1722 family)
MKTVQLYAQQYEKLFLQTKELQKELTALETVAGFVYAELSDEEREEFQKWIDENNLSILLFV